MIQILSHYLITYLTYTTLLLLFLTMFTLFAILAGLCISYHLSTTTNTTTSITTSIPDVKYDPIVFDPSFTDFLRRIPIDWTKIETDKLIQMYHASHNGHMLH